MRVNVSVRGEKVVSRGGDIVGVATGGERYCQLEGCSGRCIAVRWPDGKLTYPCTKGMDFENGQWQIL